MNRVETPTHSGNAAGFAPLETEGGGGTAPIPTALEMDRGGAMDAAFDEPARHAQR